MSMAIVMTAYNRPGYLERTLASWDHVRQPQPLSTMHDARSWVCIDLSPLQLDMAELVHHHPNWVPYTNPGRYGVLVNPVESISALFDRSPGVDFIILAEEDVVVSSDILEYFAWAQQFKADETVGVVCAHRPQGTAVENPRPEAVARIPGFSCPLIWGTWRDRWEGFIKPTWDRDYRNHGWDWNLGMVMKASGRCSIFPEQNRSDHIGEADGMHCTPAMFPETVAPDFREDVAPCEYRIVEGPA